MFGKELVGLESEPVLLKIRPDAVQRFAEASGITFDNRVPPTFVGTLMQADIAGLQLPIKGMIHGEQKFIYYRQLYVGDSLTYKRRIKHVYEREGQLGKMTFMVIETLGYDLLGELIYSSSSTLIATAKGEEA